MHNFWAPMELVELTNYHWYPKNGLIVNWIAANFLNTALEQIYHPFHCKSNKRNHFGISSNTFRQMDSVQHFLLESKQIKDKSKNRGRLCLC